MDAELVMKFSDLVTQLLVPLSTYGGTAPGERDPNDDVLVRQLRVAAEAINDALRRLTPPALPPMRPPPAPIRSTPPASEPATVAA